MEEIAFYEGAGLRIGFKLVVVTVAIIVKLCRSRK